MLPTLFKQLVTNPLSFISPAAGAGAVLGQDLASKFMGGNTGTYTAPPASMGVKATSPQNNQTKPDNTLKPSQTTASVASAWPNPPQGNSTPNYPSSNQDTNGLYGQLIGNYVKQEQQYQNDLSNVKAQEAGYSDLGGAPGEANGYAATRYGNVENARVAGLQQGLSNLVPAITAAAPQAVPYTTQFTNPVTGGAVGNPGDPQTVVNNLAQGLANGKGGLDYTTAYQQLSQFGPVAQNSLLPAILAINPNFKANQSTTNTQIQGQLPPAAENAQSQIANLQQTLSGAPVLEQTVIPAINKLAGWLSANTGIGAGGTQALQSAIVDTRSAMANALQTANGVNPSEAASYVQTLIPDGVTPQQLSYAIQQFNNQIQGKLNAFANPGTTTFTGSPTGNTTQGTTVGWFK